MEGKDNQKRSLKHNRDIIKAVTTERQRQIEELGDINQNPKSNCKQ